MAEGTNDISHEVWPLHSRRHHTVEVEIEKGKHISQRSGIKQVDLFRCLLMGSQENKGSPFVITPAVAGMGKVRWSSKALHLRVKYLSRGVEHCL